MGTGGRSCERAREWSSLRLDGELSELESRLLDAHLGRCPACRGIASEFEAIARGLRCAAPHAFEAKVAMRVRVRHGVLQLVAVAALVGVAALSGLPGAVSSRSRPLSLSPAAAGYDLSPRGLPTTRAAALRQKPPPPVPRSLALPDL